MATGHGLWASQEGTGAMIGAVIGTVTGKIVGMAGTPALSVALGFSCGLLGGEIGHLFDPPEYDEDFEIERAETRRVIEEAEEWLKKQHEWADPIARKLKVPVPCP